MPNDEKVLNGLGNILVATLALLLVSSIISLISGAVGISYPANAATNVCLWLGLALGSLFTARNRTAETNVFALGLVLGVTYGILVIMLTLIVQRLTQTNFQSGGELFLVLAGYAILGLVGTVAGAATGGQSESNTRTYNS